MIDMANYSDSDIIKGRKFFPLFFLFLSIVVFLSGVSQNLNAPLAEWDRVCLSAAENWSKGISSAWLFDHPPLYPAFLALVFRIFGVSVSVARLANVLCVLVTTLVTYKLASRLSNREAGLWAVALYLLCPISIQGMTSMDVADTSLLPLGFVLLAYCINRTYYKPNVLNAAIVGFVVAFCLWAKVTSTLALVVGVLFYPLINRKGLTPWLKIATGSILGCGIFLITWVSISIPLWGNNSCFTVLATPWSAISVTINDADLFGKFLAFGLYSLRIAFWFSPFFLALWMWKVWSIWRTRKEGGFASLDLLSWVTFFYFFGYLIIGGTNWGFPRYHAAILPLIAVLIGISVQNITGKLGKRETLILLGLISSLCLIYVFILYDPLLFLNMKLKEAMLFGNVTATFIEGILQGFLFLTLPIFVIPFFLKFFPSNHIKDKIILVLCIAALTTMCSLDLKQVCATYTTSYQYGAREKNEAIETVSNYIRKGELVLATPEFLYELRDKNVPYVSWQVWQSPGAISKAIKKLEPKVIILGLTTHTLEQLQWMFHDPIIQLQLNQDFKRYRVGTYFIWLRV